MMEDIGTWIETILTKAPTMLYAVIIAGYTLYRIIKFIIVKARKGEKMNIEEIINEIARLKSDEIQDKHLEKAIEEREQREQLQVRYDEVVVQFQKYREIAEEFSRTQIAVNLENLDLKNQLSRITAELRGEKYE